MNTPSSNLGQRAIVIGGSLAGLLSVRARVEAAMSCDGATAEPLS